MWCVPKTYLPAPVPLFSPLHTLLAPHCQDGLGFPQWSPSSGLKTPQHSSVQPLLWHRLYFAMQDSLLSSRSLNGKLFKGKDSSYSLKNYFKNLHRVKNLLFWWIILWVLTQRYVCVTPTTVSLTFNSLTAAGIMSCHYSVKTWSVEVQHFSVKTWTLWKVAHFIKCLFLN